MATTCRPGDVLQASEGKTRFVRLARLLICGGTTVMRELFDHLIPPANLPAVLSSPLVKTRLTDMKNRKILTSPQWQKLYPPSGAGSVQSTSFDITLLFKLLRENMISGLSAPSRGWDELPNIGDLSLPADMARIKYFRNGIAHGDEKMELSEQEFSDYWKEIKDALMRIVGYYATSGPSTVKDWEMAIDTLLTESLTEEDRKHVEELKSWYLDERELKQMIGSLDSRLENLERQDKRSKSKEFAVRCVVRIAGVGAWLGGTIFVLNLLKDNPEVLIEYVKYSIIPTGLAIVSFAIGSIKITMRAETVDALDKLVIRYNTGHLKEDFEKVLITEELKNLANVERIELSVEINEEELMEIRKLLVREEEAIHETVKSFCILPPKPSHQIINREDEVERLLRNIEHKNTNGITVTYLFGNTGCGKSELARQVGVKFYNNIARQTTGAKFVFTFNASCIETLFYSYIEFTRTLECPKCSITGIVTAKDPSLEKKIMQLKVLAAPKLEKYSSWLMIVDNVTDLKLVSTYLPGKQDKTSGNGQVLVTTGDKRAIVPAVYSGCSFSFSINVGMRNIDAYKTLNEISTFSTEQATISEVAKALDFQPLALACAATYTRNVYSIDSSMTWTKFLEEHKSKAAAETDDETGLTYPAPMRAAVMLALEKEMSDNILMLAFQFLSVMAPEPILLEYVVQYVKTRKPNTNDEVVAAKISSSSLVRMRISAEGSVVSVHQVVHDCLQIVMSRNKEIDIQFLELLKMVKAFPFLGSYDTEHIEHNFEASSLLSHFLAFTRKLQHYIEEYLSSEISLEMSLETVKNTTICLSLVGDICYKYGYFIASQICSEISSIVQENISDKNYSPQAAIVKKLALIYLKAGKLQESKTCFERALDIQEKAYGDDDPRLANTLNELGVSHRDLGQYQEAKTCFERALVIQEKAYGKDNIDVATTLSKLGVIRRDLGEYQEAKSCFERALAIQEKAYGKDDIDVATTLSELVVIHRDLGEYQEAKSYFERALDIQEKAYGYDEPRLATTLNEMGVSHRDVGEHQEATNCFERALAIQEKAYGKDDPRLATTLSELGISHLDLGQYQEGASHFGHHQRDLALKQYQKGKEYMERALCLREKGKNENDPQLATTLSNLGLCLIRLRQYEKAKAYLETALTIQGKGNNENDSQLATTIKNLSLCLFEQGQYGKTIEYLEIELSIHEKRGNENNPQLATTLNNLGMCLLEQRQYEMARAYLERALNILEKGDSTSENDRQMATALNNLGSGLLEQKQYDKAKAYLERALCILEKEENKNGPQMATTLGNLGLCSLDQGQYKKAKAYFEREISIREKGDSEKDALLATTFSDLGLCLIRLKQYDEAEEYLQTAFFIQGLKGENANYQPQLATSLNELGVNRRTLRQHKEAKKCFERVLAIQEKSYGKDDPGLATTLNELGVSHRDLEQHQEAKTCFERVLAIQGKAYWNDDLRLATTLNELGVSHRDLGQHGEALKCFERALDIQEKAYGDDDPRLATTLNELGHYHLDLGQHKEGERYIERALGIQEKA